VTLLDQAPIVVGPTPRAIANIAAALVRILADALAHLASLKRQ